MEVMEKKFKSGYRRLIKSMKEDPDVGAGGKIYTQRTFVRDRAFNDPYDSNVALCSKLIVKRVKELTTSRFNRMVKRDTLKTYLAAEKAWIDKYILSREAVKVTEGSV